MYLSPRVRRLLWLLPPALLVLAPGWEATLVPASHEEILREMRLTGTVVGVSRPGEREHEKWHASYVDSSYAELMETLDLRHLLTRTAPPAYVAYIPPGAIRADAYYRVDTRTHWPWWWPGGGVAWREPDD